jgi:hypothetical protein
MSPSLRLSLSPASHKLAAAAPDARADGGIRHIRLSPRGVRIERQIGGIKMHLAVPIHVYEGVLLSCDEEADQRLYKIALLHQDPELTIELDQGCDSPAALILWRSWANFFAKPALFHEPASGTEPPADDIARARPRRRGESLAKRRPRFLKRRGADPIGAALHAVRESLPRD